MRNKTISISEELFDLLKLEDNASELITRVMWDYYNSFKEKEKPKEPKIIDPITLMDKLAREKKDEEDSIWLENIQEEYREKHPEEFIDEVFR